MQPGQHLENHLSRIPNLPDLLEKNLQGRGPQMLIFHSPKGPGVFSHQGNFENTVNSPQVNYVIIISNNLF